MRHILICGMSGCTIFFHIFFIKGTIFEKKVALHKLCALIFSTNLVRNTGWPTRYRTRHFFNNFTANEDIATKFEVDLLHCVRNVTTHNMCWKWPPFASRQDWTYSCSNFVAISSLVLELLKKCQVRKRVENTVFLSLRRTERDKIKYVYCSSCKVRFSWTFDRFSKKNIQI